MPLNVHLYHSPITNASRIEKVTQFLVSEGFFRRIWIFGTQEASLASTEHWDSARKIIRIARPGFRGPETFAKLCRTLYWSYAVLARLRRVDVSCVNAHSLAVLPVCLVIKWWKKCRLVYDAHELETESVASTGIRKVCAKGVEKLLIRYPDAVCVVNESIRKWYSDTYGIANIWTVRNIPREPARPVQRTRILREAFGIPPEDLVFIYQGIVAEGRHIRALLSAFTLVPKDRHLVVLGFGPDEQRVREFAQTHSNIHFHPAVEPSEVLSYTASADVGLFLLGECCLSYYYSLPNKVFEYLHAGLAIAVSELPEVAAVVRGYSCGWVIDPAETSIATFVRDLARPEVLQKQEAASHARRQFSWRDEEGKLRELYSFLYPSRARTEL